MPGLKKRKNYQLLFCVIAASRQAVMPARRVVRFSCGKCKVDFEDGQEIGTTYFNFDTTAERITA